MSRAVHRPPIACSLPLLLRRTAASSTACPQQLLALDDHERLFAGVPTRTLAATLANLYLMAASPVVDAGSAAVRRAMERGDGWWRRAVAAALKRTVYAHFCAGETVEEAAATLRGMWAEGLRGILDYGLEDAGSDEACDRNLDAFLRTVAAADRLPPRSVSFACVKLTALCPLPLLEKASRHLRDPSRPPPPWLLPSLPVPATPAAGDPSPSAPLSASEAGRLHAAFARLCALCSACESRALPLLVDAEYTSVQLAIDHLTYAAALRFNLRRDGDRPLVYNTVQAYLRDSPARLAAAAAAAERCNVTLGVKLVRGAYLSRERQEAAARGVEPPVHRSIEETHASYDECAALLLGMVARGSAAAVLATHNVGSGRRAAARVEELGMRRSDARVEFAQLKGMADGLSMALRDAGFNVSKYLAFGPVEKVVPFLLRRAEENRGLLAASGHDRVLMRRELFRRVKVGALG